MREPAHDRALGAVVDDRDVRRALCGEDVRLGRRDLRDERLALHLRLRAHLLERVVDAELGLVGDRRGAHRPGLAQPEDERARVDALEPDEAVLAQVRPPTRRRRASA